MRTRLLALGALLILVPLAAMARDSESRRAIRVRDDGGQSRIVVRSDDDVIVLDEEALEEWAESLESLGPAIEEHLRVALSGLDEMDFARRFESMDERIRSRVDRVVDSEVRSHSRSRQHRHEADDREALEDEIQELRRQLKELEAELEELREDG